MGDYTHCIRVHCRPDEDKLGEDAQLHRVSSMLAAGWGGTGTVMPASTSGQVNFSISTPSVWRSARSPAARTIDFLDQSGMDFSEQQAPPTAQAMKAAHEPSLLDIGELVIWHFNGGGSILELSMAFLCVKADPALRDAMRELQDCKG